MIKKLINKLFGNIVKAGGHDIDDKPQMKAPNLDPKPIISLQPTTSTNATPKDIKITPTDPVDRKPHVDKPKIQNSDKNSQIRKPGRPKGQPSKGQANSGTAKKSTPKNKTNNK